MTRAADPAGAGDEGAPTPSLSGATSADTANQRAVKRFTRLSRWVMGIGWLLCAAAVIAGVATGVLTSVPRLREFLEGFGVFAPAAYTVLTAMQSVFPFLPGGITIIAAPIFFGPIVGTISSYIGNCLGSFAVFAISRHVGRPLLDAMFHERTLRRWLGWLEHRHFTPWFAAAIALPVAPDDLMCYLAGLTPMRWRLFVLLILLLKPWSILAYSFGVIALLQQFLPWLGV
ncbi:putative membrane protein YdjX (TVP38/TMEM64 family) [Kineosphaera limosa]|uniref:TVP38/TMEM64 family membrane protein n=1 Tax=Kineosphaera limosa NBRC 100340 TaxID=1184609 RepID=K6WPI8_9MICO|nr:VTT domain-containing protein [Kineosphaera limosa]NYE02195.1 putative membrane protein YdjX (TVP38/TMEM64 family) [Kineosphaera limosa]GAB94047.1 hypothetical protein KILIM_002_00040 [Kineosphaera limosa NBRC 100340]